MPLALEDGERAMRLRWSEGPRDFVLAVPRPGATVRQIGEPPRAKPARWRSREQQLRLEPPSAPNPPRPPPTSASGEALAGHIGEGRDLRSRQGADGSLTGVTERVAQTARSGSF